MTEQLHQILKTVVNQGIEIEKNKQDAGVDYQGYINEIYQSLWDSYREFCNYAQGTQSAMGDSAPDFLGWLEDQRLIGK